MKNNNNFTVIAADGTQYDMSSIGVVCSDFIIDAPDTKHYQETIDGRDGFIDMGTDYLGRTMSANCTMMATDDDDYALLRNEVFRIFDSRQPFYIIVDAEKGKHWLAKYNGKYSMARAADWGQFTIPFISSSAYAESIGTTLDNKTFDAQVWQTGDGQTLDDTMYTQTTTSFQIYNASDGETIDPRDMPLTITYTGASTNLTITNTTTGDEWQYTGSTVSTDVLKLDGIRSLKNGVSVFSDTNHKLITLEPGWNDFTLSGTSGSFSISFDFSFYTL